MEHKIETVGTPDQRVRLDMSVQEFAGLLALHHAHGGGNPFGLRGEIEEGLNAVLADLHPHWRELLPMPCDERMRGGGYTYDQVEELFS